MAPGAGPVCWETSPSWASTPGTTGILDAGDPEALLCVARPPGVHASEQGVLATPACVIRPPTRWLIADPPAGTYVLHLRSFAPWAWFGPMFHGHRGDDREFSTSMHATSRIYMEVHCVPGQPAATRHRIDSDWSEGVLAVGPIAYGWGREKGTPRATLTARPRDDMFGPGEAGGSVEVTATYEGNLALVHGSPDIDVTATYVVRELPASSDRGPRIEVRVDVRGDDFPFFETFIRDAAGNTVFLCTSRPKLPGLLPTGQSLGPAILLPGTGTRPMCSGSVEIGVDAAGTFQEIHEGRAKLGDPRADIRGDGRMDIDRWNSYFTGKK